MFVMEVKDVIFQVILSWQIWVVTIVLVIFISLVRYVSRVNSGSYFPAPLPKAKKEKAAAQPKEKPAAAAPNTDELGLEEGGGDVVEE
jgi:hypothetical protein